MTIANTRCLPSANLSEALRACAEHAAAMATAMQEVAQYAEVAAPANGYDAGDCRRLRQKAGTRGGVAADSGCHNTVSWSIHHE